jgi:hypothetical protein
MPKFPFFLPRGRGLTAEEIIARWGTEEDAIRYAQYKAANSPRQRVRHWLQHTPALVWVRRGFLIAVAVAGAWGAWTYIH